MEDDRLVLYKKIENKIIDEMIDDIIESMDIDDYVSSPLSPPIPAAVLKEECRAIFKKVSDKSEENRRVEEGMRIIGERLHTVSEEQICKQELKRAGELYVKTLFDNFEAADEALKNGGEGDPVPSNLISLGDALEISKQSCAAFYRIGRNCYENKEFEEATCVFQFLSILDSYCKEVWMSLGMCHQVRADYESSISAYSMAILLDPEDSLPYLYSAECCLATSNQGDALKFLGFAEHFNSMAKHREIESKIESLRKSC